MNGANSIDVRQNLVDLFALEEMLGYFEFQDVGEGEDHLSGICKIARSKKGKSKHGYLSLLFIIDTPEDKTVAAFRKAMMALTEDNFRSLAPELDTVVSMPPMAVGSDFHLKHVDIIADEALLDDRSFLSDKLYPAIRAMLNLETSELVWWQDDVDVGKKSEETSGQAGKAALSVLMRIKQFLGIKSGR